MIRSTSNGVVHEINTSTTSNKNKLFKINAYITASSTQMSLAPRITSPIERGLCLLASTNPRTNRRVAAPKPRIIPSQSHDVNEGDSRALKLKPTSPAAKNTRLLKRAEMDNKRRR